MVGFPGDLEDPNVVVPGLELDQELDVLEWNAIVLGLIALRVWGVVVGLLGCGCYRTEMNGCSRKTPRENQLFRTGGGVDPPARRR